MICPFSVRLKHKCLQLRYTIDLCKAVVLSPSPCFYPSASPHHSASPYLLHLLFILKNPLPYFLFFLIFLFFLLLLLFKKQVSNVLPSSPFAPLSHLSLFSSSPSSSSWPFSSYCLSPSETSFHAPSSAPSNSCSCSWLAMPLPGIDPGHTSPCLRPPGARSRAASCSGGRQEEPVAARCGRPGSTVPRSTVETATRSGRSSGREQR